MRKQCVILEHQTNGTLFRENIGNVGITDENTPGSRLNKTADHA